MFEELIVERLEKLYDNIQKIEEEQENRLKKYSDEKQENKEGLESERRSGEFETVLANYDYKKSEDRLDEKERFHLLAAMAVFIAKEAVEEKLLKGKKARLLARKILMSSTGRKIRSFLYKKGDPARGIRPGILYRAPGKESVIRSVLKGRLIKTQIASTGMSIRDMTGRHESVKSGILHRLIYGSIILEEFSPMKAFRTLSASHVLQSIRLHGDLKKFHITGQEIDGLGNYYSRMIDTYGVGRKMNPYDRMHGLFYEDGKIYGAKLEKGKATINRSDLLAKGVVPVLTQTDVSGEGIEKNINQIFRKYLIEEDISPKLLDMFNASQKTRKVAFMFGETAFDTYRKMGIAYVSKMFESGVRALDTPVAAAAEWAEGGIRRIRDPANKRIAQTVYELLAPRFGSGTLSMHGDRLLYDRKLAPQAFDLLKKAIVKPVAIAAGISALNETMGSLLGDDYRLTNIGAEVFKNTQLLYAKVFSDGFLQDIKQYQEEVMPNSTGILPIAGIAGTGLVTGATLSFLGTTFRKIKDGIGKGELTNEARPLNINPVLDMLKKGGLNSQANFLEANFNRLIGSSSFLKESHHRTMRWGLAGAAMGAIISLPLIPGALAGKTSEELKSEFSGEKDVEVRTNRGWLFGGEDFEGGKVKYYDKNWYAKFKADTYTKTMYGDQETRDELNPLTHLFSYLADPYKFEKMHEKDMPYPVWGMDVTYGGFIGEAFEATVGRIIKPTIVNPNLKNYMGKNQESGEYKIKKKVDKDEASLIKEGKMYAPIAPTSETTVSPLKKALIAALDFGGFKGFMAQTIGSKGSYLDPLVTTSELEVSGSSTTLAKTIKEMNLGDIFIFGEAQRRIINTGASSLAGRKENPFVNTMPSWLPGDESGFYIDFQHGNAFSKIENATTRLPGVGYEQFNKHLQGVNPENYPLINRYEILADVALGSKEYNSTKNEIENKRNRGGLSEYESRKVAEIEEQVIQRNKKRRFRDDKSVSEITEQYGLVGGIARGYWNVVSGITQSPLESLVPLRPGSKFIHDRTDVQDYKKNVLYGNDMALWTSPVDHFSGATIKEARGEVSDNYIPKSIEKERAINQYFDRLEFYKNRQLYKVAREEGDIYKQREYKSKMESTKIGALATGLNSKSDIFAAMRSMDFKERDYFQSFAMKDTEDKRREVEELVSIDEAKIYRKIWENSDAMEEMTEEEAIEFQKDDTAEYERRMDEAEEESYKFMEETLGVPDVSFSGWDPRIKVSDVKMRFLQIAGENIRDYGYWGNDEIEMLRKRAILNDESFLDKKTGIDDLTDKYIGNMKTEYILRQGMSDQRVKAQNIEVSSGNGSFEFIQ